MKDTTDMYAIAEWLSREVTKSRVARAQMQTCQSGQQLFLLERAQKAETVARVLRKVIKILAKG